MRAIFKGLREWWSARKPKPLCDLLAIEFDDHEVNVRVLERLEADWNQRFQWTDIVRVCFKDAGLYSSDIILVEVKDRAKPCVILTEARGGSAFFGALTQRGYFPEEIWRKAIGDTGGATHCWPPQSAS